MTINLYWLQGIIKGFGPMLFLRVPQHAPAGSATRRLLGSYVDEVDYGFFGTRCAPTLNHAWQPEFFLSQARQVVQGVDLVQETELAGIRQTFKLDKKAGFKAKASFPGAPASAGFEIDYSKLETTTIEFGEGSKKYYIPSRVILRAYEDFAKRSEAVDPILFDREVMLVDQIVIARNLKIEIEAKTSFGADVEAKAGQVSNVEAGVEFRRESDRKLALQLSDNKEYLFAVSAVEANELVKSRFRD